MAGEKTYSVEQAAKLSKLSPNEIKRLCTQKKIHAEIDKLTMAWRISESALWDYLGETAGDISIPHFEANEKANDVLIIDDDEALVQFLHRLFSHKYPSISVTSTENSYTGLSMLLKKQPDVLVLDAHLPGMNGQQLLQEIHTNEQTAHIRVLAISAYPKALAEMRELGVDDALDKPFTVETFCKAFDRLIKKEGKQKSRHFEKAK